VLGIVSNQNVKLNAIIALVHGDIMILTAAIHVKIPFAMMKSGKRSILTKFECFDVGEGFSCLFSSTEHR
jgi:hypothetical protein